jgi:hypothetical protein
MPPASNQLNEAFQLIGAGAVDAIGLQARAMSGAGATPNSGWV